MVKTLLTKSLIVVSLTYAVEEKAADLIKEDQKVEVTTRYFKYIPYSLGIGIHNYIRTCMKIRLD